MPSEPPDPTEAPDRDAGLERQRVPDIDVILGSTAQPMACV